MYISFSERYVFPYDYVLFSYIILFSVEDTSAFFFIRQVCQYTFSAFGYLYFFFIFSTIFLVLFFPFRSYFSFSTLTISQLSLLWKNDFDRFTGYLTRAYL